MAETKRLPEISVLEGPIVQSARAMSDYRAQIASLQEKEDQEEQQIKAEAVSIRLAEQKRNNFIGLVRVVDSETPPVRAEFRMSKSSALALSEETKLNAMFGAKRPLLFEREKVITQILDPNALIEEIKARGQNPWDYLSISVKSGLDRALADSKSVIVDEAFLPKKGFLETMNDVVDTLKADAVAYVKDYLNRVLSPIVNMPRAKGEKK